MGELTNATRETLAAEARKRIKSRKGKKETLAQLYDDIILSSLRVFDAYDESCPFYESGAHVNYETTLSEVMDCTEPVGVLLFWRSFSNTPQNDIAECPPSKEQYMGLRKVTHALEDLLQTVIGTQHKRFMNYIETNWWTEENYQYIHLEFCHLLEIAVEVRICEITKYFEYYENWKKEWDTNILPVHFMLENNMKDKREIWESTIAQFHNSNHIWTIAFCAKTISDDIADFPMAFSTEGSYFHACQQSKMVKKVLQFEHEYKVSTIPAPMMWIPGLTFSLVHNDAHKGIIDYVRRARAKCSVNSKAHHKWLETEAEIISHGLGEDPITPEIADRIIALANDAAREQWIEARMKSNTSDKDAMTDKLLASMVQVHLDDAQMYELTQGSARRNARLERRMITMQKTVNGEHTKVNAKSRANEKRVKDALSRYYKLVKDGTKEREATTDACRETESKMGLGDYKSFNAFRGAVAREIAERKRRYGDRAASVSLDE